MILDCVPLELLQEPEHLLDCLKDYAEFFQTSAKSIRCATFGDNCYNGKIAIKLSKFIKMPPKILQVQVPNSNTTYCLTTRCVGLQEDQLHEKTKITCFICKGNHWTRDCKSRQEGEPMGAESLMKNLSKSVPNIRKVGVVDDPSIVCFICKGNHWTRDCSVRSNYIKEMSSSCTKLDSSVTDGTT